MKKGYTNIAYSIGRGIQRRTSVDDPLSDRLLDLLDRLRERDDLEPQKLRKLVMDSTETDRVDFDTLCAG
jgi:hypothetical protein